jgi:3-dehydroquinate dehydratase-2
VLFRSEEYLVDLQTKIPLAQIQYFQSNIEGEIVDKLHEVGFNSKGVVLNAGGYTHTSVAIADAVAAITSPVIEVHISNVYSREEFRHHSLMAGVCKGVIAGFGLNSYFLAISSLLDES